MDTDIVVRIASFIPIGLCSVVGLAVTLWKWRQLRRPAVPSDACLADIQTRIRTGRVRDALALVEREGSAGARLIHVAIDASARGTDATAWIVHGGTRLVRELEYGLGALSLIATLGPLFGLLGTVVGITLVFTRLAAATAMAAPDELAGGIGTALHTTIAGLVVGVLALVSHRYLTARVDHAAGELEGVGLAMAELLGEARG